MPVGMAWKTFPMSERQMSHGSFSENLCLGLSGGLGDFALHGTRRPLRDFQHIAGYLNWALNVYPYLHPGLCDLCQKSWQELFQKVLLCTGKRGLCYQAKTSNMTEQKKEKGCLG